MLRGLHLSVLLFVCSVIAAGCSTSNGPSDNGTDPLPEGDYLRATFNGQTWTSTEINAFETPMFNSLNIAALHETGQHLESIAFSITGVKNIGTYTINPINCAVQMNIGGMSYATGLDTSRTYGTLTITTFGKGRIAGTFSCTVYRNADINLASLVLSNGSFSAALGQ